MKSSKVFATPQGRNPVAPGKVYPAKTPATGIATSRGLNAPKASGTAPHSHPAYKK